MEKDFYQRVEEIISADPRYKADAYEFLMQALMFTQKKLKRQGHVSGKELLGGVREFGLQQYGPMAKAVFSHWGINKTEDFGEMVFNMVGKGLLSKTEQDSSADFKNVYDLQEALDVFKVKE